MAGTVNTSDSIIISSSSTLSQLSVAGDNIFRMVPDDRLMIEAVFDALSYKGIEHLAVMYIDDEWGAAIFEDLSRPFEEQGGTLIGSQKYLNLRPDVLQAALDDLSGRVSDQMTVSDPSTIGFMIICYYEGPGIIELATSDPVLGAIRWFGTDGFVNYRSLLENETAASYTVEADGGSYAWQHVLTWQNDRIAPTAPLIAMHRP
jgi:hypothetical protein